MSIRWLTVQSFQNSQELLTAINTLSIHTKLELAKIPDRERAVAAEHAREVLSSFLTQLEAVVGKTEGDEEKPVLGTDPRLRQLAKRFIAAKRNRRRFRSDLFKNTLGRVGQMLRSTNEEEKRSLIKCLADLRVLLEEHLHADAERMLGGI